MCLSKHENLVKFGFADSEIFGDIIPTFSHFSRGYTNEPRDLRGYWTEVYQISTRSSRINAPAIAPIGIAIFQSVSGRQHVQ